MSGKLTVYGKGTKINYIKIVNTYVTLKQLSWNWEHKFSQKVLDDTVVFNCPAFQKREVSDFGKLLTCEHGAGALLLPGGRTAWLSFIN